MYHDWHVSCVITNKDVTASQSAAGLGVLSGGDNPQITQPRPITLTLPMTVHCSGHNCANVCTYLQLSWAHCSASAGDECRDGLTAGA